MDRLSNISDLLAQEWCSKYWGSVALAQGIHQLEWVWKRVLALSALPDINSLTAGSWGSPKSCQRPGWLRAAVDWGSPGQLLFTNLHEEFQYFNNWNAHSTSYQLNISLACESNSVKIVFKLGYFCSEPFLLWQLPTTVLFPLVSGGFPGLVFSPTTLSPADVH